VGVELVAGLPERPGSQQRHFLQASKGISLCSVLIYVQRIRGCTTMRYINLRFTYLLTYLLWLPMDLPSITMCHVTRYTKYSARAEKMTMTSLIYRTEPQTEIQELIRT